MVPCVCHNDDALLYKSFSVQGLHLHEVCSAPTIVKPWYHDSMILQVCDGGKEYVMIQ